MRVRLKKPSARDEPRFLEAARRSRAFLRQWAPPPRTSVAYRAYVRRLRKPTHEGRFVVLRVSGDLAGVINVSEIVRGAFRSAYLGYYAFVPHAGRGYMTEGLALALRWAFGTLRLHRVEANIQPGNEASRALARRLGFRREGFSPRYLKIAGRWRDHERWALLAEDWRKHRSSAVGVRRPPKQNRARRRARPAVPPSANRRPPSPAATSASPGRRQQIRAGPRRGP
jgi:ribosomal-protein-alanine N-acetyltransferase